GAGVSVRADRLHGKTMCKRDVMTNLVLSRSGQLETGGVGAFSVAEVNMSGAFVDREKVLHAIAQARRDMGCIIRKGFRCVARGPAAEAILQRLGQVPMIKRRKGLDAVG